MVQVPWGIPADDLASIYAEFVVYKAYMVFYPRDIRLRGSAPGSSASLSRTVGIDTASSGILRHVGVSQNAGTLVYTCCTCTTTSQIQIGQIGQIESDWSDWSD